MSNDWLISARAEYTPSFISPNLPSKFFDASQQEDPPLKLGILASGSGSNFISIAQAIAARQLNAQIQVLIYNQPEAKVAERTALWNVPTVFLDHRQYKVREKYDAQLVDTLKQHQVEWVIMAGWMRIVTPVLLEAFPNRVLNIHPSLLPSFPGIRAIEHALEAGVTITGCTVHFAAVEVDSGPILLQAAVPVLPGDTPETLHQRVQVQEHKIYPPAIALAVAKEAHQASR